MLESIIYKHISSNKELCAMLAEYNNFPAIFQQFAPADTDSDWIGKNRYPQIIYDIDTTIDVSRKIAGTLSIDIICTANTHPPESIINVLKNIIDGYFFTDGEDTFAAVWERTDNFTSEPDFKVFGNTLTFSLLAFPLQTTSEPDPIALMNEWTSSVIKNAVIIGKDDISDVFKPTNDMPAIYWSSTGITTSPLPSNYYCTWYQDNLRVSVVAPSKQTRNSIIKQIIEKLTADGRVIFPEGGQFYIHRLIVNNESDPIRTGQLTVEGSYGILRKYPEADKLSNITYS